MNELINPRKSVFEQIRHVDENGIEYWSAREMVKVLEYSEYRHFLPVIEKVRQTIQELGGTKPEDLPVLIV